MVVAVVQEMGGGGGSRRCGAGDGSGGAGNVWEVGFHFTLVSCSYRLTVRYHAAGWCMAAHLVAPCPPPTLTHSHTATHMPICTHTDGHAGAGVSRWGREGALAFSGGFICASITLTNLHYFLHIAHTDGHAGAGNPQCHWFLAPLPLAALSRGGCAVAGAVRRGCHCE